MALGPKAWSALRLALSRALRLGAAESEPWNLALVPQAQAEYCVPADVGDYTDFYTSVHHATSVGRLVSAWSLSVGSARSNRPSPAGPVRDTHALLQHLSDSASRQFRPDFKAFRALGTAEPLAAPACPPASLSDARLFELCEPRSSAKASRPHCTRSREPLVLRSESTNLAGPRSAVLGRVKRDPDHRAPRLSL